MFTITVTEKGGAPSVLEFDKAEISIGRVAGNDIVLAKSNISKKHARIINNEGAFVVVDSKSTNGTYINGKRIDAPYDMRTGDKIFVGDFTIEIAAAVAAASGAVKKAPPPPPVADDEEVPTRTKAKDKEILSDEEWGADQNLKDDWQDDWSDDDDEDDSADHTATADADAIAKEGMLASLAPSGSKADVADAPVPKAKTGEVKKAAPAPAEPERTGERSKASVAQKRPAPAPKPAEKVSTRGSGDRTASRAVHERLLRSLDLRRMDVERMSEAELQDKTREAIEEIVDGMAQAGELPSGTDTTNLVQTVLHEALGLGPLEDLLADESVTEILVNGPSQIYVERSGKLELTDRTFSSDQAVLGVIERIVAPIGRRIDESSPMVDARLKDGSRVNAIVPPLALRGPTLTIRKFTKEPLQVDDLVAFGSLTAEMAEFLETCVKAKKNIVISGGTGSGKTTTLNVISSYIPETERIITIEDAAELKLDQEHVISLEARPPNIEGKGAITIRDLVRNALRMRPDRIVVGECRGGEALDMLQAMNTGHDGSLTTVHANGPRDAISRLETMVLMSGMELPIRAVRDQIASAVDVVVQQSRFADGSRRITHISEITGIEGEVITMQDIFVFEQKGFDGDGKVTGRYRPTGAVPRFYENLKAMGIAADVGIFRQG